MRACAKLTSDEMAVIVRALAASQAHVESKPKVQKVELPSIDVSLDGPATYLGWSRRVRYILEGKDLEGYLTREKEEPCQTAARRAEWKSTHMVVYIWLLRSLSSSIASIVDGITKVQDIWEKLKRTYDVVGNNLRVYQIKREITAIVQGEKTVQEYAIELDRLWLDVGHFRVRRRCCTDPVCHEIDMEERVMGFLEGLAPAFEQRVAMLLGQTRIPSLEEAVSAMIQEES